MKTNNKLLDILFLAIILFVFWGCAESRNRSTSTEISGTFGEEDTIIDSLWEEDTIMYYEGRETSFKEEYSHFPEFPLPPPAPSASEDLTDYFRSYASKLKDVNKALISALKKNGYTRRSYFHVPNGFALVTQLEKIDHDAFSIPEPNRWSTSGDDVSILFSIQDYIFSLFNAKPGYYRCIVFVITTDLYSFSDSTLSWEEKDKWLNDGVIKLPRTVGKKKFTEDYTVMALIYEFKKLENEEDAEMIIPSSNSGMRHLDHSGIIKSLEK